MRRRVYRTGHGDNRPVTLTKTFRRSGFALLLSIAILVASRWTGGAAGCVATIGVVMLIVSIPVFSSAIWRAMLWRVGSRLFVSYLLAGLLPIPFLLGLGLIAAYVGAGQHAGRRVEAELARRIDHLERTTARYGPRLAAEPGREEVIEEIRRETASVLPGLVVTVESTPAEPPFHAVRIVNAWDLVAVSSSPLAGGRAAFALPFEPGLRESIEAATGVAARFVRSPGEGRSGAGDEKEVRDGDDGSPPAVPDARPGPPVDESASEGRSEAGRKKLAVFPRALASQDGRGVFGAPWIFWPTSTSTQIYNLGRRPIFGWTVTILARTSFASEYEALFPPRRLADGTDDLEIAGTVRSVFLWLALTTGVTYLLAAGVAGLLVMRIARATNRLGAAFAEVGRGNFKVRAELGGKDQLSELVAGFNRMASHLDSSVHELAGKEAIERELELARDLQRRLLPDPDFAFPGVEIATDFLPAAAIGGDFYHFVAEGSGRLVVVIADVSGHGLSTGIVMASAKASLAALAPYATRGGETVAMLETLDGEIRRTTGKRTFVTLSHARFRISERYVELTNAGHLYPWCVSADGRVRSIENPSRPLGVGLPADFRTVTEPIAAGDLWVFLSDGIIEGASPADEPFGFDRLEALLAGCGGASAADLRDRILAAWRAHTRGDLPEDDRTIVVVRIAESDRGVTG